MNKNSTSVLIVEDELPTQRLLSKMIEKLRPTWNIVAATSSVEETVEWLEKNHHPQLTFMDIQLSDGLSFEIFDQIKVNSIIIFTTAYDEYAIKAFKVNSIDYLLKPMRAEHLENAILKFENLKNTLTPQLDISELAGLSKLIKEGKPAYRSRILVPLSNGFLKLNIADIAYFQSSQKVTTATTHKGENHIIDLTLEKLEDELNDEIFFRANRQFILNINAIHRIETWFNGKLVVKTKPETHEKIIISREKAKSFKQWINK